MTRLTAFALIFPLLPLLGGCPWIGSELENERLDPDGDGVLWPDDCDDDDAAVAEPLTFFRDGDADGFGDATTTTTDCTAPDGYVDNADDCDDADAALTLPTAWAPDDDLDGFGRPDEPLNACVPPDDKWVIDGGMPDCDDIDPTVNPEATEVCNDGVDNNCDDSLNHCLFDGDFPVGDVVAERGRSYLGIYGEQLGSDLAVGDATGDGIADLVIGAPNNFDGFNISGVTYVVPGPFTAGPPLSAKTEATRALWGDYNTYGGGYSVGLTGDTNGRGPTVITGAPWVPFGYYYGYPGGSVAIYADASLDYPTTSIVSYDAFLFMGIAVAGLGDVNSDGLADVAYSVPTGPNIGVYVLHGPIQDGWFIQNEYPTELFIDSADSVVSIDAGDTNGDGVVEIFAGTPDPDGGWVWQNDGNQTGVIPIGSGERISMPNWDGYSSTRFGHDLAVVGDATGDGYDDLLVGAPYTHWDTDGRGQALLLQGGVGGAVGRAEPLVLDGWVPDGRFGMSVAAAGDADQDGLADLLVQWNGDPATGDGSGVALIYGGSTNLGTRRATFVGLAMTGDHSGLAGGTDLDGDGQGDLVLSGPSAGNYPDGTVNLLFGLGL